MNVVCLVGRLTADPELRHTNNQVSVTSFTLAVDRRFVSQGQERQTDFINIVAWRQTAEFITKYFHKGQRVALSGSLQSHRYTDKDGTNRTSYEVVADNVYFCESKSNGGGTYGGESQIPSYQEPPTAFTAGSGSDFEIVSDADEDEFVPF